MNISYVGCCGVCIFNSCFGRRDANAYGNVKALHGALYRAMDKVGPFHQLGDGTTLIIINEDPQGSFCSAYPTT